MEKKNSHNRQITFRRKFLTAKEKFSQQEKYPHTRQTILAAVIKFSQKAKNANGSRKIQTARIIKKNELILTNTNPDSRKIMAAIEKFSQ